jgi:starch synthase (maltosyl-transferring)
MRHERSQAPLRELQTIVETEAGTPAGQRFFIEDVFPCVDGGRFPVKRIAGEAVDVWADIIRDGHEVLAAALIWRPEHDARWVREPMRLDNNDRWRGQFVPPKPGRYVYAIETWTDHFATWRRDIARKREAGQDIALDAQEGWLLLNRVLSSFRLLVPAEAASIARARDEFGQRGDVDTLLANDVAAAMAAHAPRDDVTRSREFPLVADPPFARAGAWYEMMPRSQSREPGRHGTFDDCIARLPDIERMGFDVVYLPPIHPIGRTNRKGRNNALTAEPGDPGSPYAIGSAEGGHDAIHPELGTIADFRRFVAACRKRGMEVALDFAIQCSPDHPWLSEHPDWFTRRPDGSIKYAENPPKKYQDIVNPDFFGPHRMALWEALRDVIRFWIGHGVRIFRVDNPHTKPFPFWEWLIRDVRAQHPDVIFLAEAFTRPKVMKALAKLGFSQSYTYFTWRTGKAEFQEYLSELTRYPELDYYRPNFFTNTPDILPFHLQSGDPQMFKTRVALAALLSSNYGIFSGFELLEHEPLPGKEEYLDSEKYELKFRDWDRPGNIKNYITTLNRLRRENPALLQTSNLRFVTVDNDDVIGFVKESVDRDSAIAAAISVNGKPVSNFWFHFGDLQIGPEGSRRPVRAIENLQTHERHLIEWGGVRLSIGADDPALLFRCVS